MKCILTRTMVAEDETASEASRNEPHFQPANGKKHPTRNAANLVQFVVDQVPESAKGVDQPPKFVRLSSHSGPVRPMEKTRAFDSSAMDVSLLELEYTRKEIRQAYNWDTQGGL